MGTQPCHPLSRVEGEAGGGEQVRGGRAGSPYLVDAELPLEAAAHPVVERDLHGVVDVAHFVPAHLILDVQPDHCRSRGGEASQTLREKGPAPSPWDWDRRGPPPPGPPGAHSLGPECQPAEEEEKLMAGPKVCTQHSCPPPLPAGKEPGRVRGGSS